MLGDKIYTYGGVSEHQFVQTMEVLDLLDMYSGWRSIELNLKYNDHRWSCLFCPINDSELLVAGGSVNHITF